MIMFSVHGALCMVHYWAAPQDKSSRLLWLKTADPRPLPSPWKYAPWKSQTAVATTYAVSVKRVVPTMNFFYAVGFACVPSTQSALTWTTLRCLRPTNIGIVLIANIPFNGVSNAKSTNEPNVW
jgi:hypothetical protein